MSGEYLLMSGQLSSDKECLTLKFVHWWESVIRTTRYLSLPMVKSRTFCIDVKIRLDIFARPQNEGCLVSFSYEISNIFFHKILTRSTSAWVKYGLTNCMLWHLRPMAWFRSEPQYCYRVDSLLHCCLWAMVSLYICINWMYFLNAEQWFVTELLLWLTRLTFIIVIITAIITTIYLQQ